MISAMSAITPRKPYRTIRKIITNSRPAAPAIRPLRSESLPSVAETLLKDVAVNLIGSDPDCTSSAIRSASLLVSPLITLLPLKVALMPFGFSSGSTTGVATSWPSTTIALGRPLGGLILPSAMPAARACWASDREMFVNSWPPPFL